MGVPLLGVPGISLDPSKLQCPASLYDCSSSDAAVSSRQSRIHRPGVVMAIPKVVESTNDKQKVSAI